jgi:hypothetical protein
LRRKVVKLSSELALNDRQVVTLGRFRQAFQQLRQSIRQGRLLDWSHSEHPEYRAFKKLAVEVGMLLASNWSDKTQPVDQAAQRLLQITSNKGEKTWVEDSLPTR